MDKPLRIISLWLPVVIWAGIIFFFSSIPNLKTNLEYDFILRKAAHILEYFILTFFLHRAYKGSFKWPAAKLLFYPGVLALLYAISDEWHQSLVLNRHASLQDLLIDSLGILGFILLLKLSSTKNVN